MNKGHFVALAIAGLMVLAGGCDAFFGNEPVQGKYDNVPPDSVGVTTLPDLLVDGETQEVEIQQLFDDRNTGDVLEFSAFADDLNEDGVDPDEDVVAVSINVDNELVLEPRGIGAGTEGIGLARVTIIAKDKAQATAQYSSVVMVSEGIVLNNTVINEFESATYTNCDPSFELDLASLFIYNGPNVLSYNVSGSSDNILFGRTGDVIRINILGTGPAFLNVDVNEPNAGLMETAELEFSIEDGISADQTVKASYEDDEYLAGTQYNLNIIADDLFTLPAESNLTLALSSASPANGRVNVFSVGNGILQFEVLDNADTGPEIITVRVNAEDRSDPDNPVIKCSSSIEIEISVSGNSPPQMQQAGKDRVELALGDLDLVGEEVCVRLDDVDEPLFTDPEGADLSYTVQGEFNGFLVRIKDPDENNGPTITDTDNLCVTGRDDGGEIPAGDPPTSPEFPQITVTATDDVNKSSSVLLDITNCCSDPPGKN